jgi:hypothetical protein
MRILKLLDWIKNKMDDHLDFLSKYGSPNTGKKLEKSFSNKIKNGEDIPQTKIRSSMFTKKNIDETIDKQKADEYHDIGDVAANPNLQPHHVDHIMSTNAGSERNLQLLSQNKAIKLADKHKDILSITHPSNMIKNHDLNTKQVHQAIKFHDSFSGHVPAKLLDRTDLGEEQYAKLLKGGSHYTLHKYLNKPADKDSWTPEDHFEPNHDVLKKIPTRDLEFHHANAQHAVKHDYIGNTELDILHATANELERRKSEAK